MADIHETMRNPSLNDNSQCKVCEHSAGFKGQCTCECHLAGFNWAQEVP